MSAATEKLSLSLKLLSCPIIIIPFYCFRKQSNKSFCFTSYPEKNYFVLFSDSTVVPAQVWSGPQLQFNFSNGIELVLSVVGGMAGCSLMMAHLLRVDQRYF